MKCANLMASGKLRMNFVHDSTGDEVLLLLQAGALRHITCLKGTSLNGHSV